MAKKALTKKQAQLLDTFERKGRPLTAQQAWLAMGTDHIGQATIYRAIARLEELGLIEPVKIHGASPMWEAKSLGHHHHFFCTNCCQVYELKGCPDNLQQLVPNGFSIKTHALTVYGSCERCQKNERSQQ